MPYFPHQWHRDQATARYLDPVPLAPNQAAILTAARTKVADLATDLAIAIPAAGADPLLALLDHFICDVERSVRDYVPRRLPTVAEISLTDGGKRWVAVLLNNGGLMSGPTSGKWGESTHKSMVIQTDINQSLMALEKLADAKGMKTEEIEEAIDLVLTPFEAVEVSKSEEYKAYMAGSPDFLASVVDERNPNRQYGLAPYLYGLRLVIRNPEG